MPEPKRLLKVFLCHAHADRDPVRALYTRLTQDGVDAWFDKAKLLPGQDWELEIRKAVREADVVVVCLSKQFNQAGFRQKEVRLALDTAMEKPEGEIFIIPARLEECDTLESLRKWHWVDLFEEDGYERLMHALRARVDKIGAVLQTTKALPSFPVSFEADDRVLSRPEKRVLRILVTGGRKTTEIVEKVAFLIGYQVIMRGHIMMNHGTRGVDKASAEGALQACKDKSASPQDLIHVFRPQEGSIPEFNIGTLHITDQTYRQRRDHVIGNSNAVIILGGGGGTRDVAQQAQIARVPLIPIGVGDVKEAAFDIWQNLLNNSRGTINSPIGRNDLKKIGNPTEHEKLAVNAVILAENLTRK